MIKKRKSGEVIMKAITIWQPWAHLVARGEKKIETRSWHTKYRGPLAIHAAAGMPKWVVELCRTEPFKSILMKHCGWSLGKVVATCELIDCCKVRCVHPVYRDGKIVQTAFLEAENQLIEVSGNEFDFGDYTAGRYAWILEDIKPLAEPIPAKGMQRLWNWGGG